MNRAKLVRWKGFSSITIITTIKTIATTVTMAMVGAVSASAQIISWNGSGGLLPWDPAVRASSRFTVNFPGPADTTATMSGGVLQIRDGSAGSSIDVIKPITLAPADSWAVQSILKVNSHSRSGLDFGPEFGIADTSRQALLGIARDRFGILTFGGGGYVDGLSFAMDTTDAFHVFRITKSGSTISVYADDMITPKFTLPYTHLGVSDGTALAFLTITSSNGTASFDIQDYAYNAGSTVVPEPSGVMPCVMLVCIFLGRLRSRSSRPA